MEDSNLPSHVEDERHSQKKQCHFIEPVAQQQQYEVETEDITMSSNLPFHVDDERPSQKKRCHFTDQSINLENQGVSMMKRNERYTRNDNYDRHLPIMKKRLQTFTSESDYENSRKQPINLNPPAKKRRRYSFISEKEFNVRLRQENAIDWYNLTEGNIYKLENCHVIDDRIVGRMTDGYNNEIVVYLPLFFMDRLLLRDETNIKVFLRRGKGSEEVDIVTVQKWTCENCRRDFSTRNHLNRHIELCIKEVL